MTGASKGIGRAIADFLKSAGYQVTGTSRHPESIQDKIEGISYLPLDLMDEASIEECLAQAGPVDILINNAGGSSLWPAAEGPLAKVRDLFQLDLFGPIKLIQGVLPDMLRRRRGFIINIGSMAGRFAVPYQSAYSSAKFALAGFTWSLRNEVKSFGIRVVLLDPGDIRTSIEPTVYFPSDSGFQADMSRFIRHREVRMAEGSDPSVVAKKVLRILRAKDPRPFYAAGGGAPAMAFFKRFLSDRFVEKQIKKSVGLK
ncbi:MAG: SDR family oxidoreductase [Candidatus Aminicenantes bacterium]|nr:SDR family oxidoreductase [Candidatus Aminicenantes bacterium]